MNLDIFKKYDIRGIWEKDFNEEDVESIFQVILIYLFSNEPSSFKKPAIAIGHDARPSSERIYKICLDIAKKHGFIVLAQGLCSTPQINRLYSLKYGCFGRVMITASHNSWDFNGFKIFAGQVAVSGEEILQKMKFLREGGLKLEDFATIKKGFVDISRSKKITKEYVGSFHKKFECLLSSSAVLIDCMNGSAGEIIKCFLPKEHQNILFREIPYSSLEEKPLGLTAPDPSNSKLLLDTINELKRTGLKLALVFDGDADRFVVALDSGQVLSGEILLSYFAINTLEKGETFLTNVSSSLLPELIADREGLTVKRSAVGVEALRNEMIGNKYMIGGEASSHFVFLGEHGNVDDGIFTASKFLEIYHKHGSHDLLTKWLEGLPSFYSTEIEKIFFKSRAEILIELEKIKKYFKTKNYELIETDGVMVMFGKNSWILIRASNTESCLSLRIQSETKSAFSFISDTFCDLKKSELTAL